MRVTYRVVFLLAGLFQVPYLVTAQPKDHFRSSSESMILLDESGHTGEIKYRGSTSYLKVSDDPSGRYCRLIIPGHHFTSEPGQPELPVFSQLVEVPEGMEVSVTLSDISSRKIRFADHRMKGLQIYPSQRARTKNEAPDEKVVLIDKKTYETRGIIRHDTVVISNVGTFRGTRLVNVAVYPAFYDPSDGSVDLITTLKVSLTYEPGISKGSIADPFPDAKGKEGSKAFITGYTDKPVSMVIVTDPVFRKALDPLIKWKTKKGIRIRTVFRKPGPSEGVYADLKESLSAIYDSSKVAGNPFQYLLIVGDLSVIPASGGTTNVSDLYYGEFDGDGDYIPELYIGRLPARDTVQLKGLVKKIVGYESFGFEPGNTFWAGALVTAGNDAGYANIMNGQVNYIYSNYFKPDPTINGYRWRYPEAPQKDDSIKILFNSGLSILNYTGHGEAAGLSDPVFKVPAISELTNINKYPLIISNACRTAQINVTPCFGTEIVNAIDKGALAFIGCTNDSYWADDFYWSVGPGIAGIDATYENTGAGAFDRLFHTHNEEPGDWFYTLGQINFAGNLAVSSSTSSRKKYYWETYILLGDPSLSLYIGKPDTFNIQVPDTLPAGLGVLNIFAKPHSYAAISDFDTLWDAKFISPSGNAALSIPAGAKDSCLLMVTGQNMVPFTKTLYFGTVAGAFLSAENIIYDDVTGNGDGIPDYGEKINLKVTLKNLGEGAAVNLTAGISVLSGMITVEQGTDIIGLLNAGASYTVNNKFIFTVSDEISDGEMASLLLKLVYGGKEYLSGIDMTLSGPDIKIISSVHDDTATGNADFLPDAGETLLFNVRISNDGSSAVSGTLSISESSPYLVFSAPEVATGVLLPGSERTVSFEGVISANAHAGTVIPYDVNLVCGNYSASNSYSISTGKTRETWEYNSFEVFPWKQATLFPWIITSSSAFENILSARSAILTDKSESILAITVNLPVKDSVTFFSRVSTEVNYDEMIFRVDSVDNFKLSGELPWRKYWTVLNPGIHYLEWVYRKDVSLSGGLDAVWIDMITFPGISFLKADLSVDTVFAPADPVTLNNIIIRGQVINLGSQTLTSFPLSYRVNAGDPVNETFFLKIEPGDTLAVAFSSPVSLVAGTSYRIEIINRLPEDGYRSNDTARVSFIKTGYNDTEIPAERLSVSPNPFEEVMNLDYESLTAANINISLADIQGRIVIKKTVEAFPGMNRISIECSQLARGLYTLVLTQEEKTVKRKVVKI